MSGFTEQPLEWLKALYGGVTSPNGVIEFRLLPSRKQIWMPWPCLPQHPRAFKTIPQTQDVYFGISIRKDDTAGGAKNVYPTHLVWIDIDLKGTVWVHGRSDVVNMTPEELRACAQAACAHYLALFQTAGLAPRAIIYTGHGLQVYWARRARSDFADTEAYNRGLAAAFDGDPKTIDVARIFRVPGSFNLKNKDRPLPVEIWHQDDQAWAEDAALAPYRMTEKPRTVMEALAAPVTTPLRDGESVIAQWNAQHPIQEVLERYGYKREDAERYTRPGKDASGRDVKLLENSRGVLCSYHHSSNDPISGHPSDKHLREPFDLFAEYEHGGDFKSAVRAARLELGLSVPQANASHIGLAIKTVQKVPAGIDQITPQKPGSSVYVQHGSYYIDRPVKKNGQIIDWIPEQLTNWVWIPELKLCYPDGTYGERGTLAVTGGSDHEVQLESKAWNSRKDLLEALGGYQARCFTTNNSDIAKIGQYVSFTYPALPLAKGIKSYGLHHHGNEWIEVFEDQTICPDATPPLFYSGTPVDPGSKSFRAPRPATAEQVDEARRAIVKLPTLVTGTVALVLLGYGAASAFSPRITPALGNRLPFLYIAGERESGKTSGAQIVLELMTGYLARLTKASGMTPYQYDIAHSSANNLLALLDEYRPGEIDDGQLRKHHDLGTKWRGSGVASKDLAYELNAPLIVLGEGFTDDAATKSRGVLYFVRKKDRGDVETYTQILGLPLWAYASHLHELARTTSEADHTERLQRATELAVEAAGPETNPRLRYALIYIAYGLLVLQEDVEPSSFPDDRILAALREGAHNTLEGGTEGMTNLELFLEQLSFVLTKVPNPGMYVAASTIRGELIIRPKVCLDLVKAHYKESAAIANPTLFKQYAEQATYFEKGDLHKDVNQQVVRGKRLRLADVPERCDADLLAEFDRSLRLQGMGGLL